MLDKWNCHSSIHGFVAGPNIHLTMEESTHDTSCVTTSRLAADAAPSRTHQFKTDEPNKQKYISVSRRTKPTPKLTILCLYQVVCKIDLLSCFQSLNFEMLNNNTAHNNTFARDGFRLRGIQPISDKHRNAKRTFQHFACPFVWPNCSSRTKLNCCKSILNNRVKLTCLTTV